MYKGKISRKAYVRSGKAEEAKHNAEKKSTPPPQRKIFSKVAQSFKSSSVKKNWQKVKQETTRYNLRSFYKVERV